MKIDQLRKIIREEVRAAVKEELQDVLTEAVKIASTPSSPKMQQVPKGEPKKWSFGKSATLDEMLQHTAESMRPGDIKNLYGGDMVSKPNFASSMANQMGIGEQSGPQPGIDITQLDFVSKAKQVLDAANKKDKQRAGLV